MIHKEKDFSFEDIPLTDRERWEQAIRSFNCSYYCTWVYNTIIQKVYKSKISLTILRSRENTPMCMLIWLPRSIAFNNQYLDIYSPYGFGGLTVTDAFNFDTYAAISQYCLKKNIVTAFLQLHPSIQNVPHAHSFARRSGYVIDLTPSCNLITSKLSKNMRRDIKALSFRWNEFTLSDKSLIASYAPSLYSKTMEHRQASALYHSFGNLIEDFILSNNTYVLGVVENNKLISFIIVGIYNSFAEYLFSASMLGFESLSKLLIFNSIKMLKDLGCNKFYLGGGIVEGDSLQKFKKRFGSERIHLNSLKLISNKSMFKRNCESADKLRADFFPPYF